MPLRTCIAIVALTAMLAACNDNPTTVGDGLINRGVEFHSYTLKQGDFQILSGVSVASTSSAQGASSVVVGRIDDGSVAHGLLAITTQEPLLSGDNALPLKSATLKFHTTRYRLGDLTSRQLGFDIVVLDEVFSSTQKWSDAFGARITSAPTLGTFNGTFLDDSTLTVTLDTTVLHTFLHQYFRLDNGTAGQQFVTLKTLALRAHGDDHIVAGLLGTTGVVDSLHPALTIVAADGTPDDTTFTLPIGTTSWVTDGPMSYGPGKIVVNGGTSVRTSIMLHLDSIPSTATIHSAELRLTLDTANSRFGAFSTVDYLVGYLAVDSSFSTASYLASGVGGVFPVNRIAATAGDTSHFTNVFRFTTLSPAISSWLRTSRGASGYKNDGVILALNRGSTGPNLETTTLDRYTFFGTDAADPALRPALTIYYTLETDAK